MENEIYEIRGKNVFFKNVGLVFHISFFSTYKKYLNNPIAFNHALRGIYTKGEKRAIRHAVKHYYEATKTV